MEVFKMKEPIRFMLQSKKFGIISLVLVLLSWGLIFTKGFNFGIDFVGGTIIQLKYDKDAPIEQIRKILEENKNFKGAQVTHFGSNNEIVIKTKHISQNVTKDLGQEVSKMLATTGKFDIRRADMVGPKIGDELRSKGLLAMTFSILGILIYVAYRFEWRFALASVIALVHDASITIGAIILFDIEVNLDTLAAMLTLLGYSINDTIIVFDRIRERIKNTNQSDLATLIDESITSTLSRTTLTSLTVFIVVLFLFLFGGEIIKGFSFTLLVGVIAGTYSSILIASPLLIWLKFKLKDYKSKIAEREKREKEKAKQRAMYEQGRV